MTALKKTVGTSRGVAPAGRPARPEVERGRRARTNSSSVVLTCFYGLALYTKESQGQTQTRLLSAPKIRAAPHGSETPLNHAPGHLSPASTQWARVPRVAPR